MSERADKLREALQVVFDLPSFGQPSWWPEIMGPLPDEELYREQKAKLRLTTPACYELQYCYEEPLLNRRQEYHLFRKFNFLRYRARKQLAHRRLTAAERILKAAQEVKQRLTLANARLVVNLARKQKEIRDGSATLPELVSDGFLGLMRAVDLFDYRRGIKFSTYACLAILRSFNAVRVHRFKYEARFTTGGTMEMDAEDLKVVYPLEAVPDVERLLACLEPRERMIIVGLFDLDGRGKHKLSDMGRILNISTERVRQIRNEGFQRIRESVTV